MKSHDELLFELRSVSRQRDRLLEELAELKPRLEAAEATVAKLRARLAHHGHDPDGL